MASGLGRGLWCLSRNQMGETEAGGRSGAHSMRTPPPTEDRIKDLKGLGPSQSDMFHSLNGAGELYGAPAPCRAQGAQSLPRLLPAAPLQSPTWASRPRPRRLPPPGDRPPCLARGAFPDHTPGTSLPAWTSGLLGPTQPLPVQSLALPAHVTRSRQTEQCLGSASSSSTHLATGSGRVFGDALPFT